MKGGIVILEWRPVERGSLCGFAKVQVPAWRVTIAGVALHRRDGRAWAQLPSRPMLDGNRQLMLDENGKPKYSRVLEFTDREIADRFSEAVVAAVDRFAGARERVESGAF
jgi:hypothetical protein